MNYQRKSLPNTNIGSPGALPRELVGLADTSLADLTAALGADVANEFGYAGQGFFPVSDPPPPAVRVISPLAFIQRIPEAKREAIMGAANGSPSATPPVAPDLTIQVFLQMIQAAVNGVNLDDADTVNGLAYAVAKGLLSTDDVTAIRA